MVRKRKVNSNADGVGGSNQDKQVEGKQPIDTTKNELETSSNSRSSSNGNGNQNGGKGSFQNDQNSSSRNQNKKKNSGSSNSNSKTGSSGNSRGEKNKSKSSKFGGFIDEAISSATWSMESDIHEVELPDGSLLPSFYVRNLCFTPQGSPGTECYKDFFRSTFTALNSAIMSSTNMRFRINPDEMWLYLSSVTFALSLVTVLNKIEQIILNRNSELANSDFVRVLIRSTNEEIFSSSHKLGKIVENFRLPKQVVNLTVQLFTPNLMSGTKLVAWFLPLCPNRYISPIKFSDRQSLVNAIDDAMLLLSSSVFGKINSCFMKSNLYNPIIIPILDGNVINSPSLENIWMNSGRLYKNENIFRLYFKAERNLQSEFVYHSVLTETSVDTLSMLHVDISQGSSSYVKFDRIKDGASSDEFDSVYTVPDSLKSFVSLVDVFYGRIGFPSLYSINDYSPRAIYFTGGIFYDDIIFNQLFIWPSRARDLFSGSLNSAGVPPFLGYRTTSDVRTFKISLTTLARSLFNITSNTFKNVEPVNVNRTPESEIVP